MHRRVCLKSMVIASVASTLERQAATASFHEIASSQGKVQFHMDLDVDPAHEQEFLANFHKVFATTIRQHRGFEELGLMKLQTVTTGTRPAGRCRVILAFQSEKLGEIGSRAAVTSSEPGPLSRPPCVPAASLPFFTLLFEPDLYPLKFWDRLPLLLGE